MLLKLGRSAVNLQAHTFDLRRSHRESWGRKQSIKRLVLQKILVACLELTESAMHDSNDCNKNLLNEDIIFSLSSSLNSQSQSLPILSRCLVGWNDLPAT